MHSVVSDGTDTPEELLAKVREQGFDLRGAEVTLLGAGGAARAPPGMA